MQASLAATDLACRRGDRVLFRGLSFDLQAGQALHVTGANGIGKSSLLRILAGLLRPIAGSVTSAGGFALLDERPALDPHLPLHRALDFWVRLDGGNSPLERLVPLHLESLAEVPVKYLSTGQRKRAAMARLIGQPASIYLLDEPLNGLDPEAAFIVLSILEEHIGRGGIAIIASHQPVALRNLRQLALAEFAA